MPQQRSNPIHIVNTFEAMLNERLSEAQFLEIVALIEDYAAQRINRYIEFTSNQQATSKQPVINQLPSTEETSLDDLLPF